MAKSKSKASRPSGKKKATTPVTRRSASQRAQMPSTPVTCQSARQRAKTPSSPVARQSARQRAIAAKVAGLPPPPDDGDSNGDITDKDASEGEEEISDNQDSDNQESDESDNQDSNNQESNNQESNNQDSNNQESDLSDDDASESSSETDNEDQHTGDFGPYAEEYLKDQITSDPVFATAETVKAYEDLTQSNLQPVSHSDDHLFPNAAAQWGLTARWLPNEDKPNFVRSNGRGPSCYLSRNAKSNQSCHKFKCSPAFLYA